MTSGSRGECERARAVRYRSRAWAFHAAAWREDRRLRRADQPSARTGVKTVHVRPESVVWSMAGGWKAWKESGAPVESN